MASQDVLLADLRGHESNYNYHSTQQIARIAKSLATFGQVRSIVVWRQTILAGHGVVEAARSLGWQTLRADVQDHLTSDQALAYVVADNELARQSDPDQAQLAAILAQLQAKEPLLVEAAGYSAQELEQLLRSVNASMDTNGAGYDTIPEQWAVMVQCTTEIEQADLLQRLESEGYSCRALIS